MGEEVVEDRRTTCGWILRHCYGYISNGFLLYSKLFPSQRMKVVVLSLCKGCLYLCYGFFLLGILGMFTWIFSRFRYCTINALPLSVEARVGSAEFWGCAIEYRCRAVSRALLLTQGLPGEQGFYVKA